MNDYNIIAKNIIRAIRNVAGKDKLNLHEPLFSGKEKEYLNNCIDTTYVSSVGDYVKTFEKMIVDYTGAKFAVAVINGTSALKVALKLSGVENGDEVLVPALTFVGTTNAISYNSAVPHFVDCDAQTLGIDTFKLFKYLSKITTQKDRKCYNKITGRIIKAIIPVHTFGHPADLERLIEISKKFHIKMVEDAAESIGSFYKKKHTGTFGEFGILSFNGNKTITSGNGGVILTDNANLAKRAKHLVTTAKLSHKWEYIHDEIGYNYKLSNINAALGCAQLEQLSKILDSKRLLYQSYFSVFKKIPEITLFKEAKHCKSNYWLQTLILNQKHKKYKDKIIEKLVQDRIFARPAWRLMNDLKMYENYPRMDLSSSKLLYETIINIPSSPSICFNKS